MTDLFWPGDERAGTLMSDTSLLEAMVRVEDAWLAALVHTGLAPAAAGRDLTTAVDAHDVEEVSRGAESGGNPVTPLIMLLRSRVGDEAARWLHRGLTSQDVLDTAIVLTLRDVLHRVLDELRSQITALALLAEEHVASPLIGRTLTQHATPTTFGAVVASWLDGVVDAAEQVSSSRDRLPVQLGGAVGNLAATTELATLRGHGEAAPVVSDLVTSTGRRLGLRVQRPWQTSRAPLTRTSDALVTSIDAWGHIATDVATMSRSEIAELGEPVGEGRGGSSTMPHKNNPVLSVLVRRAALAAPPLGATMHLASATTGDQRPDGAWHVEWATLRTLGRCAVVAASQTTEMVEGLHVDVSRMRETLAGCAHHVLAERRGIADLADAPHDPDPTTYVGIVDDLVAGAVDRARSFLEENA